MYEDTFREPCNRGIVCGDEPSRRVGEARCKGSLWMPDWNQRYLQSHSSTMEKKKSHHPIPTEGFSPSL